MQTFRLEGKKVLEERANSALINFIVCCGIPPRVLGSDEFKTFVNTLNGNYTPPSRTTFEDSLVPTHAAAIKLVMINYLKSCRDLMLTFDGGKLGKKKIFSIHATTVHRQSFCLELDDVSRLSQTGEYIFELAKKVLFHYPLFSRWNFLISKIQQWILEIGINNWCGLSSGNTGNTNKGRRLTVEWLIRLLDMADACHNLHNACKDICNLDEFKEVRYTCFSHVFKHGYLLATYTIIKIISQLRELLAFMSLSSFTQDHFDLAREELHIPRGLQSVGETRFGTIYWSLNSIIDGIPAFKKIVRDQSIGIESQVSC